MKKTAKFILSLLLAAAIPGLVHGQDKRHSDSFPADASLEQTQKWILDRLGSSRPVTIIGEEKTNYRTQGPQFRTVADEYKLERADFEGCRLTYVVRRIHRDSLVSMDASLNDPKGRQALGTPTQPPAGGVRRESVMKVSFNLKDIDKLLLNRMPDEKTDPAVLRFGAADGREAIDLYAASKQRKGEFVLVRYVPQAALWVNERDAVVLKQAFSRAIDLCRAAK